MSYAKVLGATNRKDGYLEGNGYLVSWCVGHLVELAPPNVYDAKYVKWSIADLPILPQKWQYLVSASTKKQFGILKDLMNRPDVDSIVNSCDAGSVSYTHLAFNTSDTRGNSPSYGTTFQKMGHELLSRDALAVLDGGKCILQLRGVRPFLSDKYDLTQHPNYKLTSDYDSKNTFDIEKYLNRKEKIHPGDEFIVVDADSLPSA